MQFNALALSSLLISAPVLSFAAPAANAQNFTPNAGGIHGLMQSIARIARDNGLTPLPSATNFVAVDCGRDGDFARAVLAALVARGVFVRMPFVAPQDRCIRISCGPAPDLATLAETLPAALAEAQESD